MLKILPLTFDPERFLALRELFFDLKGSLVKEAVEDVHVESGYVFLRVTGYGTPEKAASLAGSEIKIPESLSPDLPEGVFYHYQIIGLEVYTATGVFLGKVREIIETGSNDVYSVVDREREILVPAITEVIETIDLENRRIIIREMEGLLS